VTLWQEKIATKTPKHEGSPRNKNNLNLNKALAFGQGCIIIV